MLLPIAELFSLFFFQARIAGNFEQLNQYVVKRMFSSRVRFSIKDLFDLRNAKWVPRRGPSGPTTIDAIHREAQQEDAERQVKLKTAAIFEILEKSPASYCSLFFQLGCVCSSAVTFVQYVSGMFVCFSN